MKKSKFIESQIIKALKENEAGRTVEEQKNKNRPNKLGLTTVELLERVGRKIIVKNFDDDFQNFISHPGNINQTLSGCE